MKKGNSDLMTIVVDPDGSSEVVFKSIPEKQQNKVGAPINKSIYKLLGYRLQSWLIFTVFTVLSFISFNFRLTPSFRNFHPSELVNLSISPISFDWFFYGIGNLLSVFSSVSAVYSFLLQVIFVFGGYLVFISLRKVYIILEISQRYKVGISDIFLLLLSLFYVFNSWTYEHFLMGDISVLAGHLLFPLAIYYIIYFFKNILDLTPTIILKSSFVLFSLALVSISHFIFAAIGIVVGFLYLTIKLLQAYWGTEDGLLQFSKLLYKNIISVFFIIAAPIFYSVYYLSSIELVRFDSAKDLFNSVRSFGLHSNGGVQFFQALSGAGAYNFSTFSENLVARNSLSFFTNFSHYFNSVTNIITSILLLFITVFGMYIIITRSKFNLIGLFAFVLTGSGLLLSFGLVSPFHFVNSWFFERFSFVQSGLFFSVFSVGLLLLLLYLWMYAEKLRATTVVIISIIFISSFLPFTVLSKSLNYIQWPEAYSQLADICKDDDVFYLPNHKKVKTSFSNNNIIINPILSSTSCNLLPLSSSNSKATVDTKNTHIVSKSIYFSSIVDVTQEDYVLWLIRLVLVSHMD